MTALATAAFPTFAVLVGISVNNQRLNDFARAVDVRFADTNRHIEDVKLLLRGEMELVRAGMFRMEHVLDPRLKHLEEHLLR
ncbi:MAG TPA: hypothetical protein VG297_21600 [Bryobacteraceae bacterium]|nr:hypothetical protein [Bryobacteraceae bacterium]